MTQRRAFALAAVLAGMLSTGIAQAQGDPERGRYTAQACLGCHGVADYANVYPTYQVPKLGGQHPEYILAALQAYKNGKRGHPTMVAQASALSAQEMEDIAAYFATVEASR